VPGDVVRLCLGDRVPADLRIVATSDLKTECSSLTGEPDAIAATVLAQHEAPLEARNIVFSSSLVMNGEGYGVVTKTGDATMIGSIATLAAGSGHVEETLLEKEIHRFVNFIAITAVITAFIFFGIGMGRGRPFISTFINGFIVVLVANVPEGLPATVTSCLSITAKRMAGHNVMIKRTNIIESLGSATVIASDKTGTLTQNRMTVENMWYNRSVFSAHGGGRPDVLEQMATSLRRASGGFTSGGGGGSGGPGSDRSGSAETTMNSIMAKRLLAGLAEDGDAEVTLDGGASRLVRPASQLASRRGSADTRTLLAAAASMAADSSNMTMNSFTVSAFGMATGGRNQAGWHKFSPHAKLLTIAGVCNRARYEDGPAGAPTAGAERSILGDASDAGLLRYCDKVYPVAMARRLFPKARRALQAQQQQAGSSARLLLLPSRLRCRRKHSHIRSVLLLTHRCSVFISCPFAPADLRDPVQQRQQVVAGRRGRPGHARQVAHRVHEGRARDCAGALHGVHVQRGHARHRRRLP
jgi:magnesium-transporting ATPase (P-type)